MHSQTIAIIDLGTNTFNLLIGKKSKSNKEILFSLELPVMLGKGGIQNNLLTDAGIQRAMLVLHEFDKHIQAYQVQTIKAFATSAIRNASNGKAFTHQLETIFKYQILTISGQTEAAFIYEGAKHAIAQEQDNFLVMDIGGGSVELIIGNTSHIHWKQSVEMGALRLAALFQDQDPMTQDQIAALKAHCQLQLTELKIALHAFPVGILLGTSGPFDSFSQILSQHFHLQQPNANQHAHTISIANFLHLSTYLKHSNKLERSKTKGLIEYRKDLIVVAALLVEVVMELYPFKKIIAVDYALKEGVFFSEN